MKTKIYLQFRWLLLCCFLLLSANMMAGGTDYYFKVTATASPKVMARCMSRIHKLSPRALIMKTRRPFRLQKIASRRLPLKSFISLLSLQLAMSLISGPKTTVQQR